MVQAAMVFGPRGLIELGQCGRSRVVDGPSCCFACFVGCPPSRGWADRRTAEPAGSRGAFPVERSRSVSAAARFCSKRSGRPGHISGLRELPRSSREPSTDRAEDHDPDRSADSRTAAYHTGNDGSHAAAPVGTENGQMSADRWNFRRPSWAREPPHAIHARSSDNQLGAGEIVPGTRLLFRLLCRTKRGRTALCRPRSTAIA
jgi:hypothetical protein